VAARPRSAVPPILAGDFNAEPESTEIRFMKGLHAFDARSFYMQDAYEVALAPAPGWTWDVRNSYTAAANEPNRRIDYIFVGWRAEDGTGVVESAAVTCNGAGANGAWPTDHLGVVAEIRS
jgi:endonuclease/exonuclease/phosphatase family metal-dependent hydrolase